MGILKGIIDRFRAMGKTENEISSIVEAAADKATVNPDVTKNENPQKPEIKVETTAEAFVEAVLQTGVTMKQEKTAIFTCCIVLWYWRSCPVVLGVCSILLEVMCPYIIPNILLVRLSLSVLCNSSAGQLSFSCGPTPTVLSLLNASAGMA